MILLAVSGGIDSMCLMEKVRLSGEPFAVAHCNFGLRGAESDGDEALVRSRANALGVVCHAKRFDTQAFAAAEGISIEMAARRLRYHWFGELCRDFGYTAVAVAHNANDNAETLILNLLRGTGVKGIMGMKVSGFIPDPDFGHIPLLRPLLGMTRADIEAFASEHGLQWREDATNALNDYKRNKIRNLVFPVFREINPKFVETLNRDMERFTEELSALEPGGGPGPDYGNTSGGPGPILGGGPGPDYGNTSGGPGPILGGGPGPVGMQQNGLDGTSSGLGPGGMQQNGLDGTSSGLGPGVKSGPGPVASRSGSGPGPERGWTWSKEKAMVDLVQVTEEPWDGSKPVKQPSGMLIMDADKAGELIEGRWETGDWIKPLGAPGKKKMQDWFTDHHIGADEKPFVPLMRNPNEYHHILAVVGYCIDNSVKVTKGTKRIFRISVKKD